MGDRRSGRLHFDYMLMPSCFANFIKSSSGFLGRQQAEERGMSKLGETPQHSQYGKGAAVLGYFVLGHERQSCNNACFVLYKPMVLLWRFSCRPLLCWKLGLS